MYSTHEAELDLPSLPLAARRVHIVPDLRSSFLLSMGQLCDAGCVVTFDATSVTVHHDALRLLEGTRTPATGLWHLSLTQPQLTTPTPPPLLHRSYAAVQSATPADLVAFAHAALLSPPSRRSNKRSTEVFCRIFSASPPKLCANTLPPRSP
jgi:hypothetical protein